jgi:hypothetical protein
MYTNEQHGATPCKRATQENVRSFTERINLARQEPRRVVVVVAELAGWLQARAPGLWGEAAARLARAWPGRLHAATEGVLTFWLALHLAGLLPAERLQRWATSFVELEALRSEHVGVTYDEWRCTLVYRATRASTDELSRRNRARCTGFAAGCGLGWRGEPIRPRRRRSGHPRTPGATPGEREASQAPPGVRRSDKD